MLDFYAVESLLTPEQRAIRDTVREFVDGEIIPNVREWWDRHEFPRAIKDRYGETVANAPRLEVYGSPFVGWVRVTVDPDSPGVFIVEPKLVAIVP